MIDLRQGDCLELISKMPDNSINLIVTDPPYKVTSRGGSGTTCVACKNTNRRYIGIELNPKWHKVAVDRLNNVQADGQQTLFTM